MIIQYSANFFRIYSPNSCMIMNIFFEYSHFMH